MNRPLTISLTLLAVLAGGYAFAQWQKRVSMFFPDRYPLGEWEPKLPHPHSDEWFKAGDGVRLHGWLFRAADPAAPAVIWFHGNAGNLTNRAPVAAELARRGVTTFVFDYRGFGRSEGSATEGALFDDSRAAYDHLVSLLPTGTAIVLYGESLGGPYAARVATERRASCVIIENSFPSLTAVGNSIYHPLPLGVFVLGSLPTAQWLNRAGLPVLVMHGKRDEVLPFELGQQLYDALRVKKEFFISEKGEHSDLSIAEGDRFYESIVRFIAANTSHAGGR
jgi:fermentation-respiration switch protein FrsA (DUF1100 family)